MRFDSKWRRRRWRKELKWGDFVLILSHTTSANGAIVPSVSRGPEEVQVTLVPVPSGEGPGLAWSIEALRHCSRVLGA